MKKNATLHRRNRSKLDQTSFNQTNRAWVACTPSSSAFDDRAAARGADGAATMVAKKKTSSVDNINARLSLVVKSGKISLGHRTTIKALRKSQGSPPTSSGRLRLRFAAPLRQSPRPCCVVPPRRRAPSAVSLTHRCAGCVSWPRAAKLVLIANNCPPVRPRLLPLVPLHSPLTPFGLCAGPAAEVGD